MFLYSLEKVIGKLIRRNFAFSKFICAFTILATQLLLPITPAFADEIFSEESILSVPGDAIEKESVEHTDNNDSDVAPTTLVTDIDGSSTDLPQSPAFGIEDQDTEIEKATIDISSLPPDGDIQYPEPLPEEEVLEDITPPLAELPGPDFNLDPGKDVVDSSPPEGSLDAGTSTEQTEDESVEEVVSPPNPPYDEVQDEIDQVETDLHDAGADEEEVNTVVSTEAHVSESDAAYKFNSDECARVADGSFYCIPGTKSAIEKTNTVLAASDSDGDSEIFFNQDGKLTQLTFNQSEDAAPFYDSISNTIVFHRLIDVRYQIVSLDLETNKEEVLTHESYNNMQPTRHDDLTVWQGWVGNDWEVFLYDEKDVQMITDNETHDIGPYINGNYVIWQSEGMDGWSVMVYDITTKTIRSVDTSDGASIENPRLVLVYDAKHENGDIETRGYDLISEKSVSLSHEAQKLPKELPQPDQTGEERALIVSTTQLKSKTGEDDAETDDTPLVPVVGDESTATSSIETIVVPPFGTTTIAEIISDQGSPSHDLRHENTLPPTSDPEVANDLVVPEYIADQIHIPDLVISSFDQTKINEIDPQEIVAESE